MHFGLLNEQVCPSISAILSGLELDPLNMWFAEASRSMKSTCLLPGCPEGCQCRIYADWHQKIDRVVRTVNETSVQDLCLSSRSYILRGMIPTQRR